MKLSIMVGLIVRQTKQTIRLKLLAITLTTNGNAVLAKPMSSTKTKKVVIDVKQSLETAGHISDVIRLLISS